MEIDDFFDRFVDQLMFDCHKAGRPSRNGPRLTEHSGAPGVPRWGRGESLLTSSISCSAGAIACELSDVPAWANSQEMMTAFPSIASALWIKSLR